MDMVMASLAGAKLTMFKPLRKLLILYFGKVNHMAGKRKKNTSKKNTGGGVQVGGNVDTGGGDFVGRDKKVVVGERGVVVGGNVSNSNIVTGDGNLVNLEQAFAPVYEAIERKALHPEQKADLKADVKEIEAEAAKGDKADEGFLARRLRNLRRMAPDILDVMIASMGGPVSAGTAILKKLMAKAKEEAGSPA